MPCWQVASFRFGARELDDLRAGARLWPGRGTISAAILIADGTTDRLDPVANDYALAQLSGAHGDVRRRLPRQD
jgi:hypothetical protein